MAEYSLEKRIPSCKVTKSLIEELFAYIKLRVDQIKDRAADKTDNNKIEIIFIDAYGTHSSTDLSELVKDCFDNDIMRIILTHRDYRRKLKEFTISFDKTGTYSNLKLKIGGSNSRELALGIANEVFRIIDKSKNFNFLFYSYFNALPYISGLFASLLLGATAYTISKKWKSSDFDWFHETIYFAVPFFFTVSWIILKSLSPYCAYDTIKNRKIEKWRQWFIFGISGLILFGGLSRILWK